MVSAFGPTFSAPISIALPLTVPPPPLPLPLLPVVNSKNNVRRGVSTESVDTDNSDFGFVALVNRARRLLPCMDDGARIDDADMEEIDDG
jgi:hypothetical protein